MRLQYNSAFQFCCASLRKIKTKPLGTQEIIIIAIIILLLFGGKKIPELMKGLGKGVKSFKDGVNGIDGSDGDAKDKSETKVNGESKEERGDTKEQ